MARDFNGTADYLEATGAAVTALPLTLACWFHADSLVNEHVLMCIGTNGGNGRVQLTANGSVSGDPVRAGSLNSGGTPQVADSSTGYSTSAWSHACGVFTSTTSRQAYCDGNGGSVGTASNDPSASGWDRTLIGARRNSTGVGAFLNGRVAEAGIWNVALTSDEVATLAAGYSPLFVRPASLVAYWPLFGRAGDAGDEEPWVGGLSMAQTSSPPVFDHPRIIYPRNRIWTPFASAGGGAPTLSDLKAVSVTATTVQGTYDYAF